jgi:hypothetical protein
LLAGDLRNDATRKMLDCFTETKGGGARNEAGVVGCRVEGRSYLSFPDINSFFGDTLKTRGVVNKYLRNNIFYRGFVLHCQHCKNSDWYSMDEITQEFVCHRCRHKQPYTEENWKEGDEPSIYYKLNEMVYQGHNNNMIPTILALDTLSSRAEKSFMYLTEIELRKDPSSKKPDIEIDIACIIDGKVFIGEAKKNAVVPEKLDALNSITNESDSSFVYATTADETSVVAGKIKEKKWNREPILLSGSHLFNK